MFEARFRFALSLQQNSGRDWGMHAVLLRNCHVLSIWDRLACFPGPGSRLDAVEKNKNQDQPRKDSNTHGSVLSGSGTGL